MSIIIDELRSSKGVAFGEHHTDRASSKFLITQMQKFKAAGVTAIFVEFLQENWQRELDENHNGPDLKLPQKLLEHITVIDLTYFVTKEKEVSREEVLFGPNARKWFEEETKQSFNRSRLVQSAKQSGIRVIALDSLDHAYAATPERIKDFDKFEGKRLNDFNGYTVKKTQSFPFKPKDKYLTVTGLCHSTKYKGVLGLKERLKIPAVRLMQCASQTICRPWDIELSTEEFAAPDWVIAVNTDTEDPNFPPLNQSRLSKCDSRYILLIATAVTWATMSVLSSTYLIKR